jgi:hypothetical protein
MEDESMAGKKRDGTRTRSWIVRPRARLHEFFPPDDADSYWLLRLAVLRDDLSFELEGLSLSRQADGDDVWRHYYFWRRLSITLLEAQSIFSAEVGPHAKKSETDALQKMRPRLQKAIATLQKHRPTLERVRNTLGGHLRPQNARRKDDPSPVEGDVLRCHQEWVARVTVDLTTSARTSLREISRSGVLFVWPEARGAEEVMKKHLEVKEAIFDCIPVLVKAIDALLFHHWLKHGVVSMPAGYDLGVHTTRGLVAVKTPARKGN